MPRENKKKSKRARTEKVGWREWVALPDLGVEKIKAKVDTGARSSSLHAFQIKKTQTESGVMLRFHVHPLQRDFSTTVVCEAPLHDERWIRSSNGKREHRPVIRTTITLAGESWPIDVTLTSRDTMGFRMLLGREAVRSRFVVDAGRSFLHSDRRSGGRKAPQRTPGADAGAKRKLGRSDS